MEVLRKQKLFLGAPMYGGFCNGAFVRSVQALSDTFHRSGVELKIYYLFNESLITRARNYCADEFMRSDCTNFLFIDSDIVFNAQDVMSLLAMQSSPDNTYDIIGAAYPKKNISWERVRMAVDKGYGDPKNPSPNMRDPNLLERFVGDFVFNPLAETKEIPLTEPSEVMELGTGFMMIKRSAMDKFAESYPHYQFRPDHVRTKAFDGSRHIMQYFQAEIDAPDAHIYMSAVRDEIIKEVPDTNKIKEIISSYEEETKRRSRRYLSEDYWFCQKSRAIGLHVWLCPWMELHHVGSYIFGGSLVDLAKIGAPATADPRMLHKDIPTRSGAPKINLPTRKK